MLSMEVLQPWKVDVGDSYKNDPFVQEASSRFKVSQLLCGLLIQRGLNTLDSVQSFLGAGLKLLRPLEEWPDLDRAASIIIDSFNKNEKIVVWGDYDADGITSTALLMDFFRKRIGKDVDYFLPHRMKHGYGMKKEVVESLAKQGVNTIITVDCGVSNIEEISLAKKLGMKVVLTDHHLPGEVLPPADVILNPQVNKVCPHEKLAGVGVAFFLAAKLNNVFPGEKIDIRQFLDLVAVGTIADIVDLDLTNRILVKNGLKLLGLTKRPGLVALKSVGGIASKASLGAFDVGFVIGPRINATGRLRSPDLALEVLLEEDEAKALVKAAEMDQLNKERKEIEIETTVKAVSQINSGENQHGLVAYSPDWHLGVVGIVASRVVREFGKPCFILSEKNGLIKGSGRSVPGFHLYNILSEMKDILFQFGGHSQAAGVSILPENLPEFQQRFENICKITEIDEDLKMKKVDMQLDLSFLRKDLIDELELLQPFGPCNEKPVFLSSPVTVVDQRLIGQGKHLKMTVKDDIGNMATALLWGEGQKWGENKLKGKDIVVSFYPEINVFKGKESMQIVIDDVLAIRQ